MKLSKFVGLSLPLVIGCSFYTTEVNAQTLVSQVTKQQLAQSRQTHKDRVANAHTPAVFLIGDLQAQEKTTQVKIFPGRSSIIDFRNGETITYIELANQERIVYHTNAPIESGQAKLITTRLVDPLKLEGQTRPLGFGQRSSSATNLIISTINTSGEHKSYIFDLVPATGNPKTDERNGVAIVSQSSPEITITAGSSANPTIQTSLGLATLTDIKRGLRVSLKKKYSNPKDPIIFQVQECLALAHNGVPLMEAARQMRVPISVIVSLGESGIIDQIRNGIKPRPLIQIKRQNTKIIEPGQQVRRSQSYIRKARSVSK